MATQTNDCKEPLTKSKRRRENAKAKRAAEIPDEVVHDTTSRGRKSLPAQQILKVCGPSKIQTVRGHLSGREVALICCSEAHEDAVDLTRKRCITEKLDGWLQYTSSISGLDPSDAWKNKPSITLENAKTWASEMLEEAAESEEDSSEEDEEVETDGAILVFVPSSGGRGSAYIFSAGAERKSRRQWPPSALSFEWGDLDEDLRQFNRMRKHAAKGDHEIPVDVHDELIARRKLARRVEGLELFDDWLSRQASSSGVSLELVLEAPVPAKEVEMSFNDSVGPAPPAHECLRKMELDSESDSDDEYDGGSDAYIDYLRRQAQKAFPMEKVHCIDPRELGEGSEEKAVRDSFQALLSKPLPRDQEAIELDALRAKEAVKSEKPPSQSQPALPSWEAFFGCAADVLYYHPEVKADFTPFLTKSVGSSDKLRSFFDLLFFGTIPEAVAELRLGAEERPFSRIRSLAFRPENGAALLRRPPERPCIPVKAAPLDSFLKARGSEPPRTWVSGLAESLKMAGVEEVVVAARAAFWVDLERLLANPKDNDKEGDYFEAFLRECHPEIYDDIDSSDPAELRKLTWAPSEKRPNSKKHRHNLGAIRMPNFEAAFAELLSFDPETRVTTRRERVLAKILVDAFQLKLVDLASILKMASVVMQAPENSQVVIVYFAGADHVTPVVEFWRSQGFSAKGLPKKGVVGKDDFEDDEPRGLDLPKCLHNLDELFPVPPP